MAFSLYHQVLRTKIKTVLVDQINLKIVVIDNMTNDRKIWIIKKKNLDPIVNIDIPSIPTHGLNFSNN